MVEDFKPKDSNFKLPDTSSFLSNGMMISREPENTIGGKFAGKVEYGIARTLSFTQQRLENIRAEIRKQRPPQK